MLHSRCRGHLSTFFAQPYVHSGRLLPQGSYGRLHSGRGRGVCGTGRGRSAAGQPVGARAMASPSRPAVPSRPAADMAVVGGVWSWSWISYGNGVSGGRTGDGSGSHGRGARCRDHVPRLSVGRCGIVAGDDHWRRTCPSASCGNGQYTLATAAVAMWALRHRGRRRPLVTGVFLGQLWRLPIHFGDCGRGQRPPSKADPLPR